MLDGYRENALMDGRRRTTEARATALSLLTESSRIKQKQDRPLRERKSPPATKYRFQYKRPERERERERETEREREREERWQI